MSIQNSGGDPLDFVRNMWGSMGFSLPGMATPTLDVDDLEKRINDLKTVEGWLRMNLSMLQMTIQSLEMQRTTLTAVRAMSQMAGSHGGETGGGATAGSDPAGALSQAAMWPWHLMQQMQTQMKDASAAAAQQTDAQQEKPATGRRPKKV